MLLDSVRCYNALAELALLCPTSSDAEDAAAADLPESLAAEWTNGAPQLHEVAFRPGEGIGPQLLPYPALYHEKLGRRRAILDATMRRKQHDALVWATLP